MVVADVLVEGKGVQSDKFLVLSDDRVSQIEPGPHTGMNQVGIVVEHVQEAEWPHEASQIHIAPYHGLA
jgi:hypothetical protein